MFEAAFEDLTSKECSWDLNNKTKWYIEGWLIPFHDSYWKQRSVLSKFGISQPVLKHPLVPSITIWILSLAFAAKIFISEPQDYVTPLATICAFLFGYSQWRASRYEKAMEDFYSRLGLANHKRESAQLVSSLLGHPWELNSSDECARTLHGYEDHQWSMYVYSELDNLEYILEKYKLGYMQPRHALRGLRTFYQRCARPCFRRRAVKCVRCMAYNESTVSVVKRVCEDIENRREAAQARRAYDQFWVFLERRKARLPRRSEDLPPVLDRQTQMNKAALW